MDESSELVCLIKKIAFGAIIRTNLKSRRTSLINWLSKKSKREKMLNFFEFEVKLRMKLVLFAEQLFLVAGKQIVSTRPSAG